MPGSALVSGPAQKLRGQILAAIDHELAASSQSIDFRVEQRSKEGTVWSITVALDDYRSGGLDETLEGATAWWPGPPKGAADVLSVVPEDARINLRYATDTPPGARELLRIYPPRYLEALKKCWADVDWSTAAISWFARQDREIIRSCDTVPDSNSFPHLRQMQAEAFMLLGYDTGFLWGPPGTGKTFTLGRLLAQHLVQFPMSRVLLLSTTNSAVDQALVSVDRGLASLERQSSVAAEMRKYCSRIGNHFIASHYAGLEHLIPVRDSALVRRLTTLEAGQPDRSDIRAYIEWKEKSEAIRAEIRKQAADVLVRARLAAMTTTRAAFTFAELRANSPYDLVVFDEASQVGLAHAMALVPLGRQVLFAGDPRQLAPIVQADDDLAKKWLGKSPFSLMRESAPSTCMLKEQSRMAPTICRLIGNVFYQGKLSVAEDCLMNSSWRSQRELRAVPGIGKQSVHVEVIETEGTWSRKYHGNIRYESAERIKDIVAALITSGVRNEDILILSPFRAQRTLIRVFIKNAGIGRISVSTVHRAQGTERHTVMFDAVSGCSLEKAFGIAEARRLVNVALSRAQARLVLLISSGDKDCPLIEEIADAVTVIDLDVPPATPIHRYFRHSTFPDCLVGEVVEYCNRVYRVKAILAGGEKFEAVNLRTGETRTYVTSAVMNKCRADGQI